MNDSILDKLGITEPPWKREQFESRGVNKVKTNEIHFGEDGECVAEYVYSEVDALLISSAPEMLEALIDCLLDVEYYYDLATVGIDIAPFEKAYQDKIVVLEKATGKTWAEIKELMENKDERSS